MVEPLQLHTVCGVPLTTMLPVKGCAVEGAATAIMPDATLHRMPARRTVGNDMLVSPVFPPVGLQRVAEFAGGRKVPRGSLGMAASRAEGTPGLSSPWSRRGRALSQCPLVDDRLL